MVNTWADKEIFFPQNFLSNQTRHKHNLIKTSHCTIKYPPALLLNQSSSIFTNDTNKKTEKDQSFYTFHAFPKDPNTSITQSSRETKKQTSTFSVTRQRNIRQPRLHVIPNQIPVLAQPHTTDTNKKRKKIKQNFLFFAFFQIFSASKHKIHHEFLETKKKNRKGSSIHTTVIRKKIKRSNKTLHSSNFLSIQTWLVTENSPRIS